MAAVNNTLPNAEHPGKRLVAGIMAGLKYANEHPDEIEAADVARDPAGIPDKAVDKPGMKDRIDKAAMKATGEESK